MPADLPIDGEEHRDGTIRHLLALVAASLAEPVPTWAATVSGMADVRADFLRLELKVSAPAYQSPGHGIDIRIFDGHRINRRDQGYVGFASSGRKAVWLHPIGRLTGPSQPQMSMKPSGNRAGWSCAAD